MPIAFEISETDDFYIARYEGKIRDSELVASYRDFFIQDLKRVKIPELADFSHADFSEVTSEGLWRLAQWGRDFLENQGVLEHKTAVYAPGYSASKPMAVIYDVFSTDSPEVVRFFEDRDEAVRWLTEV